MSEVKSNGKRKQRFAKVAKKSTDSTAEKKKSSLETAAAELMKKQSLSSQQQAQPQQGTPPPPPAPMKGLNRFSLTDSDPLVDSMRSQLAVVNSLDASLAKKNMWSAKKNLLKSVRLSPRPVRKDSWSSKGPQPDIDAELNSLFKYAYLLSSSCSYTLHFDLINFSFRFF